MSKKTLTQQAEDLGIKVDGRWSDERIQQEIDKAEPKKEPAKEEKAEAPKKAAEVPSLHDYIRNMEGKHAPNGVVLVEVSHPSADGRVFPGIYGGIRTVKGDLSATYSDGSHT